MLTKEERKATAERMGEEFDYTENDEVYEALIGEEIPNDTSWETDCKVVRNRLIELCDTSNMVELPHDKDGQVIHIGDTVFDDCGSEWVVSEISFKSNGVIIDTFLDGEYGRFLPYELTHKQPETIKSLAQRIKHILEDEATSIGVNPYVELGRIADKLESLGDSDEE